MSRCWRAAIVQPRWRGGDSCPSWSLRGAALGSFQVALEQPCALQPRHSSGRPVDPSDLLSARFGVAEQVQREGVNFLLGLDAGANWRPQVLEHPANESLRRTRALHPRLALRAVERKMTPLVLDHLL